MPRRATCPFPNGLSSSRNSQPLSSGQTMLDSNTVQLIFVVPELFAFLSESFTLEPGDVIATGTPSGVGFARKPTVFRKDGDLMEVEIEKLGTLRSPVIAARQQVGKA